MDNLLPIYLFIVLGTIYPILMIPFYHQDNNIDLVVGMFIHTLVVSTAFIIIGHMYINGIYNIFPLYVYLSAAFLPWCIKSGDLNICLYIYIISFINATISIIYNKTIIIKEFIIITFILTYLYLASSGIVSYIIIGLVLSLAITGILYVSSKKIYYMLILNSILVSAINLV